MWIFDCVSSTGIFIFAKYSAVIDFVCPLRRKQPVIAALLPWMDG